MAGNSDPFQQSGRLTFFPNHSPFVTEAPMSGPSSMGQQVPDANFQFPHQRYSGPVMGKAQMQAPQVVQGLYSIPPTPELQYDDLWANSEPDMFAQENIPLYDVAPGDVGMIESFGFEPHGHGLPDSTSWNPSPAFPLTPGPHANIYADGNTWAVLSQALPDSGGDGSSSGGLSSLASAYTGQGPMREDPQGFSSRPIQHEVAQHSAQGSYPFRTNEFRGNNVMDMVMEDSISDGISSTEDPSWRQVSPSQIPHGYGTHSSTSGISVLTSACGQRSSQSENNFSHPQQLPDARESFGVLTEDTDAFHDRFVDNDFTQLMGPGLSAIRQLGEPRWSLQLLNLCASAIASANITRTQHLMWVLNDLASFGGDVNQRFAAYGLRALYMRVTNQMEAIQTFLRPRHHDQEIHFGPKMVHRALVKFHEHVPWHQNCYSASSQTLLEVCAGKSKVHLIDIGAGKAIEWPIFIDALVSRPGGPPSILRITMIKDRRKEEQKSVNSEAADFMTRLVKFASGLGLHVEVNAIGKALECVTREDLQLRHGEILAVVCQFRLHRLSNEVTEASRNSPSPSFLTPRDEFIDFLFSLNPHVFIMSDNDADHTSLDFLTRFESGVNFWWTFFEMLDNGYAGRDTQEREIIEYEAGSMLLNIVACEGVARIERNEPYARWSRRIQRAGFVPKEISDEARKVCQNLVNNHGEFWEVSFDANSVSLLWRKTPMTFASVWATPDHCSKNSCKCSMLHN